MSNRLDYARRLYESHIGWYVSADSKAQVILAIDTGLLAFLTSTLFSEPTRLSVTLAEFSLTTWIALALMLLSLIVSIVVSVMCIWSRTYSLRYVNKVIEAAERKSGDLDIYPAGAIIWFFQFIVGLNQRKFLETLKVVDEDCELKVLSDEIYILAKNVRDKHRLVNIGFVCSMISLLMLALAAMSYLYSVYAFDELPV